MNGQTDWKTTGPVRTMFEHGVFKEVYEGVIEIYPRRVAVSLFYEAALKQLADRGYNLVEISSDWLRAYAGPKKKGRSNV